jgi:hypothetical protein
LVVAGIAREWGAHEDTILQATDLLALSLVSNKKRWRRKRLGEEKVRLFFVFFPKMEGLTKSRRRRRKVDLAEEKALLFFIYIYFL